MQHIYFFALPVKPYIFQHIGNTQRGNSPSADDQVTNLFQFYTENHLSYRLVCWSATYLFLHWQKRQIDYQFFHLMQAGFFVLYLYAS